MASHPAARESRHLWVGGLPDEIDENGIKEYFTKFGKIEGVKILPQRYPNLGVAAFIDFYDVRSAIEAKETKHVMNNSELRTNFKSKPTEKYMYDYNSKRRQEGGVPAVAEKTGDESGSSSSSSASGSSSSSSSDSDSDDPAGSGKKAKKKDSLLLKVTSLAHRPERVIQDGLYYEFTRYCPGAVVRMYGEAPDKLWAVVKFKKAEECRTACQQTQGMALFGSKVKLTPLDKDDFPSGGRDHSFVRPSGAGGGGGRGSGAGHPYFSEDLDPSATRSLFVGNIPKDISVYELRDIFQRYGNVLDVEIKKMTGNATYGFVLFYDLMCAVTAKQYLDGENVHGNNLRVGFGKGTASKTIWLDGIDPSMPESQLERHMSKFGEVVRLGVDRQRWCAMVQYDSPEKAKEALTSVKGSFIANSRRLMTDFANRDARAAFFSRIDSEREGEGAGPPHRGFPGMYNPGMMAPRGGGGGAGMMMVRPALPMMGGGRGGGAFHRPPMDYYYQPYVEDMSYYGGGRPPFHAAGRGGEGGPGGMRRYSQGFGQYDEGYEDYDDELRAFSRKRERDKAREKHRKRRTHSSSSEDSEAHYSSDSAPHKRRKAGREKHKKSSKKDKENPQRSEEESEEGGAGHDQARLKATQKARDLRDKLKKKPRKPKQAKREETDGEATSQSEKEDSPVSKKTDKSKRGKGRGSPSEEKQKKASPKKPHESSPEAPPLKPKVKRVSVSPKTELISKSSCASEDEEEEEEEEGNIMALSPPSDIASPPQPIRKETTPPPPPSPEPRTPSPSYTPAEEEEEDTSHTAMQESDEGSGAVPETPQSPPVQSREATKKPKLESDLSSGEDFRESEPETAEVKSPSPPPPVKSLVAPKARPSSDVDDIREESAKVKSQREKKPRTPDTEPEQPKRVHQERPAWRDRQAQTYEDLDKESSEHENSRKPAKIPRRYQMSEEEVEPVRREAKHRELKEYKRSHHPPPVSPSPPPSFVGHRRRHYHSSPPPEYGERRWHRKGGRPYSPPGPYPHRRSPPSYPPSPPPYRGRSPFSGSPPPRPRTPIPRPRDRGPPRHRYSSPPYEQSRGKFTHMRGSPPPPPHHRHYSLSPPPRSRSPGRRHMRHPSPPPSSPPPPSRRSPLPPPRWRERSRSADSGSPLHGNEERYPRYSKRPVFSRSPSPKPRHRETAKDDFPEAKRRKLEKQQQQQQQRPKSPSASPPPPAPAKEEAKPNTTPATVVASGPAATGQPRSEPRSEPRLEAASKPQYPRHPELPPRGGSQPEPTHTPNTPQQQQQTDNLLDLLRRYPVMWQGHLFIKNDGAAVQLHFLSGNVQLASLSLPQAAEQRTPNLRISQRMRLENSQLEGVDRRMQNEAEHCLLLALPCGRDANDVRTQTHALKNSLISYLLQKKAAGIINIQGTQSGFVLHIFPPCPFSQAHLSRVAPDLLSSASDNCHLMIVVATT